MYLTPEQIKGRIRNLATLTVAATTGRNNYQFRCIITDAKNNSVISDAVKMTVK